MREYLEEVLQPELERPAVLAEDVEGLRQLPQLVAELERAVGGDSHFGHTHFISSGVCVCVFVHPFVHFVCVFHVSQATQRRWMG